MCLIGVLGKERDYGTESVYDEIMTENFIQQMFIQHVNSVVIDTATKGEKSRVRVKRR